MKINVLIFAGLVLLACSSSCFGQVSSPAAPQESGVTELEEVVVVGSALEKIANDYVSAVSAPSRGREPAAWRYPICVGVGGMAAEPARVMADRVSDWAHSLGLTVAQPGCTPNVFIVATEDGDATARDLVASRPREFRLGVSGADRGAAALRRFEASGKLVRWWHVSLPVEESTGRPAVPLPGDPPFGVPIGGLTRPMDFGSYGITMQSSRLADPLRDDLQQVIIVLDADALAQAEFGQIADYVSMVALAQVDPDATPASPSILNLFQPGAAQEATLSRWDQAYLRALYSRRMRYANRVVGTWTMAAETVRALEADPRATATADQE